MEFLAAEIYMVL